MKAATFAAMVWKDDAYRRRDLSGYEVALPGWERWVWVVHRWIEMNGCELHTHWCVSEASTGARIYESRARTRAESVRLALEKLNATGIKGFERVYRRAWRWTLAQQAGSAVTKECRT